MLNTTLHTIHTILPARSTGPVSHAVINYPLDSVIFPQYCRHATGRFLEWSKATNLIYRASINKKIVPSLIALLNNGCMFGNHFPISHHFPLNWLSRPPLLFFLSFPLFLAAGLWWAGVLWNGAGKIFIVTNSLSLWPNVSQRHHRGGGCCWDCNVLFFWFILPLLRGRKCQQVWILQLIRLKEVIHKWAGGPWK